MGEGSIGLNPGGPGGTNPYQRSTASGRNIDIRTDAGQRQLVRESMRNEPLGTKSLEKSRFRDPRSHWNLDKTQWIEGHEDPLWTNSSEERPGRKRMSSGDGGGGGGGGGGGSQLALGMIGAVIGLVAGGPMGALIGGFLGMLLGALSGGGGGGGDSAGEPQDSGEGEEATAPNAPPSAAKVEDLTNDVRATLYGDGTSDGSLKTPDASGTEGTSASSSTPAAGSTGSRTTATPAGRLVQNQSLSSVRTTVNTSASRGPSSSPISTTV